MLLQGCRTSGKSCEGEGGEEGEGHAQDEGHAARPKAREASQEAWEGTEAREGGERINRWGERRTALAMHELEAQRGI